MIIIKKPLFNFIHKSYFLYDFDILNYHYLYLIIKDITIINYINNLKFIVPNMITDDTTIEDINVVLLPHYLIYNINKKVDKSLDKDLNNLQIQDQI